MRVAARWSLPVCAVVRINQDRVKYMTNADLCSLCNSTDLLTQLHVFAGWAGPCTDSKG